MVGEEDVALSPPAQLDNHKRKLDELESEAAPPLDQSASPAPGNADESAEQVAAEEVPDASDAKRPRVDDSVPEGLGGENGYQNGKEDAAQENNPEKVAKALEEDEDLAEAALIRGNDELSVEECGQKVDSEQDVQLSSSGVEQLENVVKSSENDPQPVAEMPKNLSEQNLSEDVPQPDTEQNISELSNQTTSRRMEVPNNMVGVLIGKAGETIRSLQLNSGAKIQITRDADADPGSATRPMELIGTVKSINMAEKLIKEVMAEADAGGSPALVARGFTLTAGVMEQIQIQVPNEKVGLIIGKGGETIKNLQTRSCARIQLLPQHLGEGDKSKERTLRVSGDKKQIDIARELIEEAMNQNVKYSSSSINHGQQQAYRPRGPPGALPQWGPPRNTPPASYDYQQHRGGPYPSQTQQYPPYGGYPSQGPQRGNFGSGWEQRPPIQGLHNPSGGYNYYGGQANARQSAPHPTHVPSGSSMGYNMPSYGQANYNYGQPPYSQTQPSHQGYNQAASQQPYGGPHGSSQPGSYQDAQGYPNQQQQYPNQQQQYPPAQSYPASQPGTGPYQAPVSAPPSYGQTIPAQHPYPYGPVPPTTNIGYGQPQPAVATTMPGYPQQGASQPVAGYGGQPAVQQQAPAYSQAYGQYPPAQQGYINQTTIAAASYGYQGQPDPSAYAAAGQANSGVPSAVVQTGYAQPTTNQASYDQSAPQQQPGSYPAPAPAAASAPVGTQPAAVYPQQ